MDHRMGKKRSKFYAVASGRTAGVIVSSWDECKDLVFGYAGAKYKSFSTREDAKRFLDESSQQQQQQPSCASKRKTGIPLPEQPLVALPASSAVVENPYRKRIKLDGIVGGYRPTSIIRVHIMFDGGARGNPGIAGAGAMVALTTESQPHSSAGGAVAIPTRQCHLRCYVGEKSTNNVAEYTGLVQGLVMANEMVSKYHREHHTTMNHVPSASSDELIVQGDSNLIIQQLQGNYKVKNARLKELFGQVQSLLQELRLLGLSRQVFEHVYRDGNKVADALANEAMDARRSWYTTSADNHRDQLTMTTE